MARSMPSRTGYVSAACNSHRMDARSRPARHPPETPARVGCGVAGADPADRLCGSNSHFQCDLGRQFQIFDFAIGSNGVPYYLYCGRVLRAAVLNELKSDYVTYARARGFSNAQIVYGEVLRNALPAAITLFAQYCAALFGTSALVESVFSIQGLGIYLMDSCESMDIYGISGSILVCGVLFVLFNTLADLLSSAICPAYRRKAV